MDKKGKEIYEEYTPEQIKQFIIDRDLKRTDPDTYKLIQKNPKRFNELLREKYRKSRFMPVITENINNIRITELTNENIGLEAEKKKLEKLYNKEEEKNIVKLAKLEGRLQKLKNVLKGKQDKGITSTQTLENQIASIEESKKKVIEKQNEINTRIESIDQQISKNNADITTILQQPKYEINKPEPEPDKFMEYLNKPFLDIKKEVYNDANVPKNYKDAEVGNRVENYLNAHTEIFNTLQPDNIGDTINTTNAFAYYTIDAINEINRIDKERKEQVIPYLLKGLAKFQNDLKKAEDDNLPKIVKDTCINNISYAENQIYKKSRPVLDYFVTDYISDNNLFEIKALKYKYSEYQVKTYKSNSYTNVMYKGKNTVVEGGINFVARKVTGEGTSFKPIFEKKDDGSAVVKNVRFHYNPAKIKEYVDTLPHEYNNYNAIFFLEDGIYKYDILNDDKLIIDKNGIAKLDYPKRGDDYIIPMNKLVKVTSKELLHHNIPYFPAESIMSSDPAGMIVTPDISDILQIGITSKSKNTKRK